MTGSIVVQAAGGGDPGTDRHGATAGEARRRHDGRHASPLLGIVMLVGDVRHEPAFRAGAPDRGRRLALAAGADLGQWRQAALARDQEVAEPAEHDLEVLDAPERRPRAGELVGLLGHAQQPDRPPQRAQDREQRLGLADRRAQVALASAG